MRLGLEPMLSLALHDAIHQRGKSTGHDGCVALDTQGRAIVDRRAFVSVGHGRFLPGNARLFQANPDVPPFLPGPLTRVRPPHWVEVRAC